MFNSHISFWSANGSKLLAAEIVRHFNKHHECALISSDRIFADEVFPHWYGKGGGWINIGFPMYASMERNQPVDAKSRIFSVAKAALEACQGG
jgi:hypothetical protein